MRPSGIKRFTRAELYDLVWSQPMTKIASSFDFSDVWLKKICKKHDIPVPGRGYWRRIETGKKGRKPTLRTRKEEEPISVTIYPKSKEESVSDLEAVEAQKIFEQHDENRINVPDILERPHSITAATRKHLRAQKPDEYGMLKCAQPGLFSLRVGPASVDRALGILDALLKAAERRGFRVKSDADERGPGHVLVNGEAISFLIDEPSERNDHRLTNEEKARQAKGTLWGVQKYDYVPTGKLTLRLQTPYSSGIQGIFRDIARKRVEERLNDVIVAMVHVAEWTKESRQKHAEKQRRVDAENARRADIRQRQQDEAARVKQLQEDADAWNAAEALRRYVAAADAAAQGNGRDASPGSSHYEWRNWVLAQADRIDPLRASPSSILDEKAPEFLHIWQVSD